MALPLWLPAATGSMRKAIHLGTNATVAGKPLRAGDYDLLISGNKAKFESKGKVVAEVACTWKTLLAMADHGSCLVLTSGDAATEITFQAKTQAIDF
jgi:hypothetical protein